MHKLALDSMRCGYLHCLNQQNLADIADGDCYTSLVSSAFNLTPPKLEAFGQAYWALAFLLLDMAILWPLATVEPCCCCPAPIQIQSFPGMPAKVT